jgi:hypothetical protein
MNYLLLILLLLFITVVSSYTGSFCNREGLDANNDAMIGGGYVNVGSRSGNCAPSILPGNNNFTSKESASQFCFDWNQKGGSPSCTAILQENNGSFQARGCSSDAIQKGWCKGFPKVTFQEETCNVEQGGTTWFYKKPDKAPPSPPSSSQFRFEGCYSNNPRVFSNWDPNNLKNNPNRNSICEKKALSTNNKYYGLENNNGCLVFNNNFPSNTKLNVAESNCTNGYQVAVFQKSSTFHPPAPPPHAPWNINSHVSHIQNPIMGHGEFNTPLPIQGATFLKRETLTK